MTAQEFVKERYPRARVEHYNYNDPLDKKGYWLCWSNYKGERLSEGNSASNAWVNAKKNIIEDDKEKQQAPSRPDNPC